MEPYSIRDQRLRVRARRWRFVNATVDGVSTGFQPGQEGALDVGTVTVVIAPGGVGEVEFYVLGPPPSGTSADVNTALALTPGVNDWTETIAPYQPCVIGDN